MLNFKTLKIIVVMAASAGLMSTVFVNCSETEFSRTNSEFEAKAEGTVEVIDTEDLNGERITKENERDLSQELKDRARQGQIDYVEIGDASCEGDDDGSPKVIICHIPPRNLSSRHDICISVNALKAHVGEHTAEGVSDAIGRCADLL